MPHPSRYAIALPVAVSPVPILTNSSGIPGWLMESPSSTRRVVNC